MSTTQFIRIGDVVINTEQITAVDLRKEYADTIGPRYNITIYLSDGSLQFRFAHNTPESIALLGWLKERTQVLYVADSKRAADSPDRKRGADSLSAPESKPGAHSLSTLSTEVRS